MSTCAVIAIAIHAIVHPYIHSHRDRIVGAGVVRCGTTNGISANQLFRVHLFIHHRNKRYGLRHDGNQLSDGNQLTKLGEMYANN